MSLLLSFWVFCVGNACQLLSQWDEAISKLQKAHELTRRFCGEKGLEAAMALLELALALYEHEEYRKALPYFQEASEVFDADEGSADEAAECVLYIAHCYDGLKNVDCMLDTIEKLEQFCSTKPVCDELRLKIHKTMAEIFTKEEYEDRCKGLCHLKQAEVILKRIKQSEKDEQDLKEIQAKIMSLELV